MSEDFRTLLSLSARYAQVTVEGTTATDHTESRIGVLGDSRLCLREDWSWDARERAESVVEEVREGQGPRA